VKILVHKVKILRQRAVPLVKVLWRMQSYPRSPLGTWRGNASRVSAPVLRYASFKMKLVGRVIECKTLEFFHLANCN